MIQSGIGNSSPISIEALPADIYTINVTSYCGTEQQIIDLTDTQAVEAQILSEDIYLQLAEGNTHEIHIGQLSENASQHAWFLNNEYIHSQDVFTYTIEEPAIHVLTLMANNSSCIAEDTIQIHVDRASMIEEQQTMPRVTFIQAAHSLELFFNQPHAEPSQIQIHDIYGRIIWQMIVPTRQGKNISIGTDSFAAGTYILNVITGEKIVFTQKIVTP